MPKQPNPQLPLSPLKAISTLDGRYRNLTENLTEHVSEYALIKTRIEIEILFLITLSEKGVLRKLTQQERKILLSIKDNVTLKDAAEIKKIENKIKHDVKAIEMLIGKKLQNTSLRDIVEMIHFGLTSEDVNNIAYRLQLKRGVESSLIPKLEEILQTLTTLAKEHKATPMLARTHGQPAIPTTLGKEMVNFAVRLHRQILLLKKQELTGKITGAVGNFNALVIAYPNIDWLDFSKTFVQKFDLAPNIYTTQINPYEDVLSYLQTTQRINGILIDFDQDMWRYISDNWFVQKIKSSEVGSSTMPQKVNPILFENSEGNLGIANGLIEFFTRKLAISRLQRDLSDSTVIRNVGTILGFCTVGYTNTTKGMSTISPNILQLTEDLYRDWSILTEAVQTVLRKEGIKNAYTLVKSLSRGEKITQKEWSKWVNSLPVAKNVKESLRNLTPKTYIGSAVKLTEKALSEIKSKN